MREFLWMWKNKVRMLCGYPSVQRNCCKNLKNRGPVVQLSGDLCYARCTVCGSRHFELVVDPGVVGLQGENL